MVPITILLLGAVLPPSPSEEAGTTVGRINAPAAAAAVLLTKSLLEVFPDISMMFNN
jgi:hypothetical protein